MKRFKLSSEAASDIREIWLYVANDNLKAARRVRLDIWEACRRIAEFPRLGHKREDITTKPVLFWPAGPYLIVYNPEPRPIEIVRVLHGGRDLPVILTDL